MQQYLCWQYDAFGNRLQQASSSSSFSSLPDCAAQGGALTSSVPTPVNPQNQVTGVGGYNYSYDGTGNLTGDGLFAYNYDAAGRLCAVRKNVTGETTAYLYDASGKRVGKGSVNPQAVDPCDFSANGFTLTSRSVLGLDGETLTRYDNEGNSRSELPVSGGISATLTAAATGPVYTHYQFTDWVGTRRLQTDPYGNPEEKCSGGAFGDALQCIGYGATDRHFTGKERDLESAIPGQNNGLDYFEARYYNSAMGRFTSPDPSGLYFADPTNSQTFNLYSYALNNPIRFIDPSGLTVMCQTVQKNMPGPITQTGIAEDGTPIFSMAASITSTQTNCHEDGLGNPTVTSTATPTANSKSAAPNNIAKRICGALPSGTVASVSPNGNLTGGTGSLDLVTNLSTGEVTGYVSPGYFIGPTGAGASLTGGYTFGDLGPGNANFSRGFTGAFGGAGIIAGSVATSSAGPMNPTSGISPGESGHVTTVQFGLQTPGRGVAAISTFSVGKSLGKYWTLMDPATLAAYAAKQACKAAGY